MKKILISLLGLLSLNAFAGGFSVGVSPPRFELKTVPGKKITQVLEIHNRSNKPEQFQVKTNDWYFNKQGKVVFTDKLLSGSCRPWVKIERRVVRIAPGKPRKYRFEINVPANAPHRECKFALMLRNSNPAQATTSGAKLPVSGQLGVIVYLAVGNAQANLKVIGAKKGVFQKRQIPLVTIKNIGSAHGRLSGSISGKDASGKRYNFSISTFPIMPGKTRVLALTPNRRKGAKQAPVLRFPVSLKGTIYWEKGTIKVNRKIH